MSDTDLGLHRPAFGDVNWDDRHNENMDLLNSVLGYGTGIKKVRVIATANVAIATALINASTIDGVVLATGDRVFLAAQTAPAEIGIYVVVAAGVASRSSDMNVAAMFRPGTMIMSTEGTLRKGWIYKLTQTAVITVNTTAITHETFYEYGPWVPSDTYTAGLLTGIADCVYEKIGKRVHIEGKWTVDFLASLTQISIDGLPFVSRNHVAAVIPLWQVPGVGGIYIAANTAMLFYVNGVPCSYNYPGAPFDMYVNFEYSV